MQDLAKKLDLVNMESPLEKIEKQVAMANDPNDSTCNIEKETRYNNIIEHIKCALSPSRIHEPSSNVKSQCKLRIKSQNPDSIKEPIAFKPAQTPQIENIK